MVPSCQELLKKLTILFVEDEKEIRVSLSEAISDQFALFVTAKNGMEGLELFRKKRPDIVVTDIQMPELDGLAMAEEILKLSPKTPVIILSAFSEKERLLKAIDTGVNKYLIKPFDPDELLSVICEMAKKLASGQVIELAKGFMFDLYGRILYHDGKPIPLTKSELLFIELLAGNKNHIATIEEIQKHVWGEKPVSNVALRAFIKRLRQKTSKEFIKNISGVGYRIG